MIPETNIILAPMSGVTDLAFRLIAREFGARFCFFEMIDAKALLYKKEKNIKIVKTVEKDSPIAAQLLGAEPDIMKEAALKLTNLVNISFLDINCACPAKKVIKKKAGAALLGDSKRASAIIKILKSSVRIPVTVKMRAGYDRRNPGDTSVFAKTCEDAGAGMLFVHGRTRAQGYSGSVDYGAVKSAKEAVSIPVFGSGDIFDGPRAKKMLDKTGCDGVLIARGACGNPWVFKAIENYLNGKKPEPEADLKEKKKALKKHLVLIKRYSAASPAGRLGIMRKVSMWYLKGISDAARMRDMICRSKNERELLQVIVRADS